MESRNGRSLSSLRFTFSLGRSSLHQTSPVRPVGPQQPHLAGVWNGKPADEALLSPVDIGFLCLQLIFSLQ
ncbi:hypothetical protein ACOSP7_002612 [Xanthoceras sorbifolium]